MKLTKFFFLAILIEIFNCSTCEFDKNCKKVYKFEIPVHLSPALDSFSIGDTIWIDILYSHKILDFNSQELINVDSFDFNLEVLISEFNSITIEDGIDNFAVIENIGNLVREDLPTISLYKLKLINANGSQRIRFGLLPLINGNFLLAFNAAINKADAIEFIDTNCEEHLEILFKTNNAIDNNFEFYKSNSHDEGVTLEGFNYYGNYAFAVVE